MEKELLDSKQMHVSSSVLWAPVYHKNGSMTRDRFFIGTYGTDLFSDVVISALFGSSPVDPSNLVVNSQLYHFMAARPIIMPSATFPDVNFGIELQVMRCSTLTIDYFRDLLVVMGVPLDEISDITYESDSIIIYCLNIHAAAYIMKVHSKYVLQPAEWSIMLRSKCSLKTNADSKYTPSTTSLLTGVYPGVVFAPIIFHNVITQVSLSSNRSRAQKLELKMDQSSVPSVVPIIISARPTLTSSGVQEMTSLSPDKSLTISSLTLNDKSRGKKRNSGDMESQSWMDILVCNNLSDYQIELIISMVRAHVPNSPSLFSQLEYIISPTVLLDHPMELDGDLKS
jgi:hypothetical protein